MGFQSSHENDIEVDFSDEHLDQFYSFKYGSV